MEFFDTYREILRCELVYATGCTEPIAIAYAAAVARQTLGAMPERLVVLCSGNIVKNVKSVIVPGTGGLRGIEAAALIGAVGGDAGAGLNVLHGVTDAHRAETAALLESGACSVGLLESEEPLHIRLSAEGGAQRAEVEIRGSHTNIVGRRLDGEELAAGGAGEQQSAGGPDYECLSLNGILDYAEGTDLSSERELLESQIECNRAIAIEGFLGEYGLNVGRALLEHANYGPYVRAAAMAASGSDARMSGCLMPVVINSGSGNQGMTASIPVIEFARELQVSHDKMLRALVLSNLVTIHLKTGIGTLSAYCGAVSAGCGSGAGIAYLYGGDYEVIAHTVVNSLAIVSGIICDGAKASCAAKISAAVDAGIMGYEMYIQGQQFYGGDGIVTHGVENTIRNVGQLAKEGMCETDKEIIRIMVERV